MRDEGDRFVAWRLDDAPATPETDFEQERMEGALLAYAHRSAARVGAEWFAAEFARREEEDRVQEARAAQRLEASTEPVRDLVPEITLTDASVENAVVGGAPTSLGLEPAAPEPLHLQPEALPPVVLETAAEPVAAEPVAVEPVAAEPTAPNRPISHPHVPRPPAPEPPSESKRRRRHHNRTEEPAPSFVISAPEWARMSPGARRLYGLDAAPNAAGTG
jgi:hypothetical protein